jgi:hypothetical protein
MATIAQNTAHEKVTAKALSDAKAKGTLSLKNLIGKWNNCDKNTRGLVRLVLGTKGSSLTVQGFGSCSPTPCDWGVVEGTAYGESVVATEAIAFTARYDFSFKETIVTGHLDNGTLIVETFDKFKDGSGRSNYYSRVYLCRS